MKREALVYWLHGPRDLRLDREELPPNGPRTGEVVAKTLFSAISVGTEVAAYRGDPPLRPTPSPYPRLMGYCNVAEIVALGEGVGAFRQGDRIVTSQSHRSAFVTGEDAIFATLPEGLDAAVASLVYLFHLGYQSLLSTGVGPGTSVAVVGLGPIGLAAAACCHLLGADATVVSDRASSHELAAKWGLRAVSRARAGLHAGQEVVVSTSNRWSDWRIALEMAGIGATVGVVGFPGRGEAPPDFNPLDSRWLYDKRLTLKAVGPPVSPAHLKTNIARLLEEMRAGRLEAGDLIGGIVNWDSLGSVYEQLDQARGEMVTAVLRWQ